MKLILGSRKEPEVLGYEIGTVEQVEGNSDEEPGAHGRRESMDGGV